MSRAAKRRSLPASLARLTSSPAYIVFSDFDGTITTAESDSRFLAALGFGPERRLLINKAVLQGQISVKHAHSLMMNEISMSHPYEEALAIAARTLEFDPGFKDFWSWCKSSGTPLVVVSSGLTDVIKAALEDHLGPDAAMIRVIANDVRWYSDHRQYGLEFRHPDSPHGHVKARALDEYRSAKLLRKPPCCIFLGDGVSDMSAARSADLLFVKIGPGANDLKTHCDRLKIPFVPFANFYHILNVVSACVEGRTNRDDLLWEDSFVRAETVDEDGWCLLTHASTCL